MLFRFERPEIGSADMTGDCSRRKSSFLRAKILRKEVLKSEPRRARKLFALADIQDCGHLRFVAERNNVSQQTIYNSRKIFYEKVLCAFEFHVGRPKSKEFASRKKCEN
jgi:hypothetical protein